MLLAAPVSWAQTNEVRTPPDLAALSVEELMRVTVTSVSRGPEEWFRAPAAVHVITGDEIRRAGVTSIPEALRLAPGMDVACVDSHTWAVSARGLNSVFSRFLLVLVDGRAVYTPMFAGVFWDVQDTLLEDVDRIEVIRGPGATLWGANAVNGVINIITKPARETTGLLVTAGGGTAEQAFGAVRYGVALNPQTFLRVYGKGFLRDDAAAAEFPAHDDWWQSRGGARLDWTPTPDDQLTLQGEFYRGDAAQSFLVASNAVPFLLRQRIELIGGHMLGRWAHTCANEAEIVAQAWYDHAARTWQTLDEERDTVDVELQTRFPVGARQQIIAGAGYRVSVDDTRGSDWAGFTPAAETLQWVGGFVQNDITLVPERWHLSLGTKIEHNDYTGWEFQPGGRLAWTPNQRHTVWGAIARAVRTPSRADTDLRFAQEPVMPGVVPVIYGNRQFQSENLLAFEVGHRWQLTPQLTTDLALFYNIYDDVRSAEVKGYSFPELRVVEENRLHGETYGGELVVRWQPVTWCRLEAQYSLLQVNFKADAISNDSNREENAPHHQGSVRVALDLPRGWEFNSGLRVVERLAKQETPAYVALDARLAWRPSERFEVALVGQNLLDGEHPEFSSLFTVQRTQVERSFYGKVTWRH